MTEKLHRTDRQYFHRFVFCRVCELFTFRVIWRTTIMVGLIISLLEWHVCDRRYWLLAIDSHTRLSNCIKIKNKLLQRNVLNYLTPIRMENNTFESRPFLHVSMLSLWKPAKSLLVYSNSITNLIGILIESLWCLFIANNKLVECSEF